MIKETGGPAFPASGHPGQQFVQQEGMTLRDYFAAKAMQGILSDPDAGLLSDDLSRYSKIAYQTADSMLKARGE
ncbi:hypothetical protein SAMN05216522_1135 [Rosenbergiella nectarea]|uniref:Uncharacterized protein n=1 Tax=Rosenbergiella nectarea TaxID=988801 RepID=A0A1H9LZI2_9GAMM|nr:hypothetical protein [Rosenbergiella nectarea]SER16675.1 hypothetical protein SAMN05216522_1135 [Rosenbergiella nectarea]